MSEKFENCMEEFKRRFGPSYNGKGYNSLLEFIRQDSPEKWIAFKKSKDVRSIHMYVIKDNKFISLSVQQFSHLKREVYLLKNMQSIHRIIEETEKGQQEKIVLEFDNNKKVNIGPFFPTSETKNFINHLEDIMV